MLYSFLSQNAEQLPTVSGGSLEVRPAVTSQFGLYYTPKQAHSQGLLEKETVLQYA